ncbi:hypothetical protein W97_04404 [Coniosporium apollinis CBS 100218]|uniref:White collar 1 protein n=1 Tax=Coniosporium apollinis (strain CBS 100218) TaxID=1168221 RepID=R7YTC0_CONA1|nr:uncharacterized protein W97_04404 [Coniosporium apollinis CBS 100218]EON65167.1 hypothetical protein W97_04404 [Coniosporium apollinis CBS 100218]
MNGMSYYPRQYTSEDLQRLQAGNNGGMMDMLGPNGLQSPGVATAQSLDDIVSSNSDAMRRRSMPLHYGNASNPLDANLRRVSMMEFSGASSGGALDAFQFSPSPRDGMDDTQGFVGVEGSHPRRSGERRRSGGNLILDTQFPNQGSPYANIPPPGSAYASPMHTNAAFDLDMTNPYIPTSLSMSMDLTGSALPNSMIPNQVTPPLNMFSQQQFQSPIIHSPLHQSFSGSIQGPPQDPGGGNADRKEQFAKPDSQITRPDLQSSRTTSGEQSIRSTSRRQSGSASTQGQPVQAESHSQGSDPSSQIKQHLDDMDPSKFPWQLPQSSLPSTMNQNPHTNHTQWKNIYSSTGFDMLGVLMRVATRPHPEINIGSVDMSCAFVVCDAEKDDNPIVYCSENFERLTGYNKHMILGRNCRFLQSPDGKVEAGVKRKYVDDNSVLYLKNMINLRKEAQISLINYRRGGQPFMNLLTMIPITWDTDEVKFFVGFQVDLVEQPNSVTNRNPDGSCSINYQRGFSIPRYTIPAPENTGAMDLGQTVPRDDVSTVLSTIGTGESELSRRIWDKVVLENTDDVVHVLSLKGLFLYLSPASRKVLEYEPSELVGTALSSVCHPSDIVPVTRELKETSNGASVNVVFRIRRKHSGYTWFEGHGCLHTEQGKGRKCIILVGRERPVYALSKTDVVAAGGIGDNELWMKMSTSGMFLFVSSNVRQLLDRQPDELVGTSIQVLMRQDSKQKFGRILELARAGRKAQIKHEMINKRGQVLQAFTTLYPGDAVEGQKPTFIVAQTRLLKFSRGGSGAAQRPPLYHRPEQESSGSINSLPSTASHGTGRMPSTLGSESTLASGISGSQFVSTEGAPATFAGHNGLAIGHQDESLASEENVFDELKTTRSTSWQYELRQMEKRNRLLAEEVQSLLAAKKKRKRRKGAGQLQKDCANCHTRVTPEWRRGPSGNRDLCNSCGLRWAKQNGRVSPRTSSQQSVQSAHSDKASKASAGDTSPQHANVRLPNSNEIGQSTMPSTVQTTDPKLSAQQAQNDSHAAKVARMEVQASQGFAGGIPPKIDEDVEPD